MFCILLLTNVVISRVGTRRTCPVCDRPAKYHGKYCPVCWRFCNNRHPHLPISERIKALKEALDKDGKGFRCFYTGKLLAVDDPDGPWYLTFDHMTPGKKRIVVCARLINEMKKDLTGDEFRIVVPALSDHLEKGVSLDAGLIEFVCWPRRFEPPGPAMLRRTPPSLKGCAVCGMTRRRYSLYCDICRHFIFHKPEHVARVKAMV